MSSRCFETLSYKYFVNYFSSAKIKKIDNNNNNNSKRVHPRCMQRINAQM